MGLCALSARADDSVLGGVVDSFSDVVDSVLVGGPADTLAEADEVVEVDGGVDIPKQASTRSGEHPARFGGI